MDLDMVTAALATVGSAWTLRRVADPVNRFLGWIRRTTRRIAQWRPPGF